MEGLLEEGRLVLLKLNEGSHYKTPFTLVALISQLDASKLELINLNTHIPVKWLCEEFNENSPFEFFREHQCVKKEPSIGRHRFDLLLKRKDGKDVICEIKSTTKIIDRRGFFPDAVSSRATRHVKALHEYAKNGGFAIILFIVQSDDVDEVVPDWEVDPMFAKALSDLQIERFTYLAFTSSSFIENPEMDGPFEGQIVFVLKRQIEVSLLDDKHT